MVPDPHQNIQPSLIHCGHVGERGIRKGSVGNDHLLIVACVQNRVHKSDGADRTFPIL